MQPLAEYRRDVFDFREKTNQIANNYSPVDRIDEVIVNNPDLRGMKISEIYDALTSNEFNTNYENINMISNYGQCYYSNYILDGSNLYNYYDIFMKQLFPLFVNQYVFGSTIFWPCFNR